MTTSARFWNRMAKRYAAMPVADEAAYQHKLALTRGYLTPDMSVLEVGCGTGSTALVHAPFVREILATDLSEAMIAIAQKRAEQAGTKNVRFEVSDLEDLAAGETKSDAVLALNLLHLLPDLSAGLAKIQSCLTPGGVFVSSTFCIADMRTPLKYLLPVGKLLGLIPPILLLSRSELEAALVEAGFDLEQIWHPGPSKAVFIVARKRLA